MGVSWLIVSRVATLCILIIQVTSAHDEGNITSVTTSSCSANLKAAKGPPFANDGYEWPTLYEEADDMLDAALLMYPLSELRKMAKLTPEKFEDPEKIRQEPATATEIEAILTQNMKVLRESFGEDDAGIIDTALDTIIERQRSTEHRGLPSSAILVQFGDDNSEEELVYAIGVDMALKRVTLAFRGSVTRRDFLVDSQIWMEDIPNPLASQEKGQPKKIGIHNGFHDYLFYKTTTGETHDDGSVKNKYEIILDEVVTQMKKYPGFKLYVTGHSLGAALSSLFAFMAATTRDDIPKPVTCVSIASPYVGDSRWLKAFQLAERQGKIRYLRISNEKDIVSIVPILSLRLRMYKHVGVNLRLYPKRHEILYSKVGKRHILNTLCRWWVNSIFANPALKYLRNHGTDEYNIRLERAKDHLDKLYLNDIYKNGTFVGDLVRGLEVGEDSP